MSNHWALINQYASWQIKNETVFREALEKIIWRFWITYDENMPNVSKGGIQYSKAAPEAIFGHCSYVKKYRSSSSHWLFYIECWWVFLGHTEINFMFFLQSQKCASRCRKAFLFWRGQSVFDCESNSHPLFLRTVIAKITICFNTRRHFTQKSRKNVFYSQSL